MAKKKKATFIHSANWFNRIAKIEGLGTGWQIRGWKGKLVGCPTQTIYHVVQYTRGRRWCGNMKRIVFQNLICLTCINCFACSIYLLVYTVVDGRNMKHLQNFICFDSEGCSSYLSCCAIYTMDVAGAGIWNVLLVSPSSASQLTAASASPHLPAAPGGTPPSLGNIDTTDNNKNDKNNDKNKQLERLR